MKNTIKNIALTALIGASAPLIEEAKAEVQTENEVDFRAKTEYIGDFAEANTFRETLAFGNEGSYDGRTSIKGQFFDQARLISTQNPNQNQFSHMLGLRLEPQKLFETSNYFVPTKGIVFGSINDNCQESTQSIGSEMNWKSKNTDLFLRGEFQNGSQLLSHLGGTFRYNLDNLTFQIGEDYIYQSSGDFNQIFANISLSPNRNNFYALTFAHQNLPNSTENNRLRFTAAHFGKDASWGHRSFAEYSWNPKKDQQSFSSQIALVPFGTSTYGKIAARLFTEDTWDNNSLFSILKTPFALYTEAVPHFDRIAGSQGIEGLGFVANASLTKNGSLDSTILSSQVHYIGRIPESDMGNNEYGFFLGVRYNNNGQQSTYLDAGATLRFGNHFALRAQFGIPLQTETLQKVQGTLEAELKF